MDYSKFLAEATKWAIEAGEVQLEYFRSSVLRSNTKQNDFDVVTEADKSSEKLIMESIARTFPDHGILSEESGEAGKCNSEWRWVIDPLDGTTNFSKGLPVFSVSIALEHNGEIVVGVVYAPYLHDLFQAAKGCGATLNGEYIHCKANRDLPTMVVATGMPYDRAMNPDNNLDNIARVCTKVRGTRRMGSAAIDLCYTAAGFFDAYWELNLNPWDVAAGALMMKEAGGTVRSIRDNRNISIIAGHEETLEVFSPLIH